MAVDYRWTSSYDQGTLEATIWNRNASNIVIYCPEGQEDTTPGMFLEVKRIKPQRGESVTVQIVVDGDSFPFELNEIQFPQARGPKNGDSLRWWIRWWRANKSRLSWSFRNTTRRKRFRFSTRASRSDRGKARY
jgi:hypothetical protein